MYSPACEALKGRQQKYDDSFQDTGHLATKDSDP